MNALDWDEEEAITRQRAVRVTLRIVGADDVVLDMNELPTREMNRPGKIIDRPADLHPTDLDWESSVEIDLGGLDEDEAIELDADDLVWVADDWAIEDPQSEIRERAAPVPPTEMPLPDSWSLPGLLEPEGALDVDTPLERMPSPIIASWVAPRVSIPRLSYPDGLRRRRRAPLIVAAVALTASVAAALSLWPRGVEHVELAAAHAETAPVAAPAAPSLAKLVLSSKHPEATVMVDGQSRGRLPVELADIAPGDHEIVVSAPLRKPLRRKVALAVGEVLRLDDIRLELAHGRLTIALATEGAHVVFGRERRSLKGPWPMTLDVEPGDHDIIAVRNGYRAKLIPVRLDDSNPEQSVTIELVPAPVTQLIPADIYE